MFSAREARQTVFLGQSDFRAGEVGGTSLCAHAGGKTLAGEDDEGRFTMRRKLRRYRRRKLVSLHGEEKPRVATGRGPEAGRYRRRERPKAPSRVCEHNIFGGTPPRTCVDSTESFGTRALRRLWVSESVSGRPLTVYEMCRRIMTSRSFFRLRRRRVQVDPRTLPGVRNGSRIGGTLRVLRDGGF